MVDENSKLIILGCTVLLAVTASLVAKPPAQRYGEMIVLHAPVERPAIASTTPRVQGSSDPFIPFGIDGRAGDAGRIDRARQEWIARNPGEGNARLDRLMGRR